MLCAFWGTGKSKKQQLLQKEENNDCECMVGLGFGEDPEYCKNVLFPTLMV